MLFAGCLHHADLMRMLYAMEAYQRSILISASAPCGPGVVLRPLKSAKCPAEMEIVSLPLCEPSLLPNTMCEADVEAGVAVRRFIMFLPPVPVLHGDRRREWDMMG